MKGYTHSSFTCYDPCYQPFGEVECWHIIILIYCSECCLTRFKLNQLQRTIIDWVCLYHVTFDNIQSFNHDVDRLTARLQTPFKYHKESSLALFSCLNWAKHMSPNFSCNTQVKTTQIAINYVRVDKIMINVLLAGSPKERPPLALDCKIKVNIWGQVSKRPKPIKYLAVQLGVSEPLNQFIFSWGLAIFCLFKSILVS